MPATYTVFGLRLHCNLRIPGLVPVDSPSQRPDVEIVLGTSPADAETIGQEFEELVYISPYTVESGEPALKIWKLASAFLRLDYFDGSRFWIDRKGTAVWSVWSPPLSLEDVATYLLGPVLGPLLRLRGVPCLHASAVALGDSAVAFVGSEGAGKSTTAAALANRGYAVISDDVVALVEGEGSFLVLPSYPYLSLWPESVELLYGTEKQLPTFSAIYHKRQLLLAENRLRFHDRPMPLGALFLLGERTAAADAPFLETPTAQEKLLSLVANSYATNILDSDLRAREFELFGRLVSAVPMWRLRPHENGSGIARLCGTISEQCHALQQSR